MRLASLLVLSAAVGCGGAPTAPPNEPGRAAGPNLVLIVTDDMSWSEPEHLPTLQSELVARGTTFTRMFVTTPTCSPSRVSILRGQYAHNHAVRTNRLPDGGFRSFLASGAERSTLATWLQAAGYRTLFAGKYLNTYPIRGEDPTYIPPGWDEWYGLFSRESYLGYTLNDNGTVVKLGRQAEDYQTDVLKQRVLGFVARAARRPSVPFFVFLAPYAPHGPAQPAARHADALPGLSAPRTPAFNEADMSDKPPWMRGLPALSEGDAARVDERFRRRVLSLLAVDELLAELLRSLEAHGQLDNTYLLVTSDNGFHLGSHRKSHGKADAYEEAARVPLFVRGPGVAAGRSVEALAANIDLAPTLAELAGIEPPSFVDGRSLATLLTVEATPDGWRQDLVVENWALHEEAVPHYSALRTTSYLYVEYETGDRELYDLERDPHQLENIFATADPGLLKRLAQRLASLRTCAGASCRE